MFSYPYKSFTTEIAIQERQQTSFLCTFDWKSILVLALNGKKEVCSDLGILRVAFYFWKLIHWFILRKNTVEATQALAILTSCSLVLL